MRRAVNTPADSRVQRGLGFAAFSARTSGRLGSCVSLVRRVVRTKFALTVIVLLSLPIFSAGWSVRAGFVVDVRDSQHDADSAPASGLVAAQSATCSSGATFSDSLRRTPPASPSTQNVRPSDFPVRTESQVPFDGGQPSPFAPPKNPPVNYHSSHGMGGSQ